MNTFGMPRRRLLSNGVLWSMAAAGGALGIQSGESSARASAGYGSARSSLLGFRSSDWSSSLDPESARQWNIFRSRYIVAEPGRPGARVIDNGNRGISHTEGQGLGMLLAVSFDDRQTFDSLWTWTDQRLARPQDALHRWRYDPGLADPVADDNNASDGDLLIGGALWRAANRWNVQAYADAAPNIAADVARLLVVNTSDYTLLLPGADGFRSHGAVTINPSYYCFPAIADLARAYPSPCWAALIDSAQMLIEHGRFGKFALPPDWLQVGESDGSLSPAPGWPARFSYDAIRVPLYLAWSGHAAPSFQCAFARYCATAREQLPAWVDLVSGEMSPYNAPPGMVAVSILANRRYDHLPSVASSQDYYSSALTMLSRIAAQDLTR